MKRLLCMGLALLLSVCLCTSALADTVQSFILRPEGNNWESFFPIPSESVNACGLRFATWKDGVILAPESPWTKPATIFLSPTQGAFLLDNDAGQWYRLTWEGLPLSLQQAKKQLEEAAGVSVEDLLGMLKADSERLLTELLAWWQDFQRKPPIYMLMRKLQALENGSISLTDKDVSMALRAVYDEVRRFAQQLSSYARTPDAWANYNYADIFVPYLQRYLFQLYRALQSLLHRFSPSFSLTGNVNGSSGGLVLTCEEFSVNADYAWEPQTDTLSISGEFVPYGKTITTFDARLSESGLIFNYHNDQQGLAEHGTFTLTFPADTADTQSSMLSLSGEITQSIDTHSRKILTFNGHLNENGLVFHYTSPKENGSVTFTVPPHVFRSPFYAFRGVFTLNIVHNDQHSRSSSWSADLALQPDGFVLGIDDTFYQKRSYLSLHADDSQMELRFDDISGSAVLRLTREDDDYLLSLTDETYASELRQVALRLSFAPMNLPALTDAVPDLEVSAIPAQFLIKEESFAPLADESPSESNAP